MRPNQAGTPLLAASCGTTAVVLGEAEAFDTAYYAPSSSLLVVRQRDFATTVLVVTAASDGRTHVEDLTSSIVRELGQSGRPRTPLLVVDLTRFASDGSIMVAPDTNLAVKAANAAPGLSAVRIDLTRTLAVGVASSGPAAIEASR